MLTPSVRYIGFKEYENRSTCAKDSVAVPRSARSEPGSRGRISSWGQGTGRCSCDHLEPHAQSLPKANRGSRYKEAIALDVRETVRTSRLAGSCPMQPATLTCFGAWQSTWTKSSKARSPLTFPSSSRSSSNLDRTSQNCQADRINDSTERAGESGQSDQIRKNKRTTKRQRGGRV